jgi:hypothetical protein
VAIIQHQGSRASSPTARVFFVDTSVVFPVWWEFHHARYHPDITKASEQHGLRLIEKRVPVVGSHHGADDEWLITADTDLVALRADLVPAVGRAADRLIELLAPGRYLAELWAKPQLGLGSWQALVLLEADRGPSPALDAAIAGLQDSVADRPAAADYQRRLIDWARNRAATASRT